MAIKAESVEQFSLEVIFPSSNYEAAMPELHKAHWLLQKFLQIFFTLVLIFRTQFRENKWEIWSDGESHSLGSQTWGCSSLFYYCDICLCYLSFLWKTNTQKKGYILKATASKCLPGGYSFLCLFSWFPLGQCREALSHLWRPSEWDENKTGGNDSPHERPHHSEDQTPEWEWYVHIWPR